MWTYSSSKDILKVVGLKTIDHYIGVRQETIARLIVDRHFLRFVGMEEEGEAQRVAGFWWEQPLSLDNAGPPPGDEEDKGEDNLLLG